MAKHYPGKRFQVPELEKGNISDQEKKPKEETILNE